MQERDIGPRVDQGSRETRRLAQLQAFLPTLESQPDLASLAVGAPHEHAAVRLTPQVADLMGNALCLFRRSDGSGQLSAQVVAEDRRSTRVGKQREVPLLTPQGLCLRQGRPGIPV